MIELQTKRNDFKLKAANIEDAASLLFYVGFKMLFNKMASGFTNNINTLV